MTKTEAIEVLKGFVLYAEKVKSYTFLGDENIPIEALNMAIEALEKQSPCDKCENEKKDWWEMCQFCPAEPKGSDEE